MVSRRLFGGCLICAGLGLIGSEARAQGAPGFSRKVINQTPLDTKYDVIQVLVSIDPGALIARHTHPGIESSMFVAGGGLLSVQGMPDRLLKASDWFEIPPELPHSLKNGEMPSTVAASYTVERGKPLSSPAPE